MICILKLIYRLRRNYRECNRAWYDTHNAIMVEHTHTLPNSLCVCQNVLHDVPDYEERSRLLESLKNKLEALLSPRLVSSLTSHNLGQHPPSHTNNNNNNNNNKHTCMYAHLSEEAREYAKMFKDIERHSQLRSYYIGCNKVSNLFW